MRDIGTGHLDSLIDFLSECYPGRIEVLSGPLDHEIGDIRLIERVDQIDDVPTGALLVLERGVAGSLVGGYQFDVMVRRAAARKAIGFVVLLAAGGRLSLSAMNLARRAEITVVRVDPEVDLTDAVRAMVRFTGDLLGVTVDRARAVCEALNDRSFEDIEDLLGHVSVLLGRKVELGHRPDHDVLTVPAGPRDTDSWIWTNQGPDAAADALLEMVLWRVAAETTRRLDRQRHTESLSRRSSGELLVQLLSSDRAGRAAVAPSARRLGIPVDGWHIVVRIEPDNLLELVGDEVIAFELREEMAGVAVETASATPGVWNAGHEPDALLLLHTTDVPPDAGSQQVYRQIESVLASLVVHVPGLRAYCGVGTTRPGIAGLNSSAAEARVAVSTARFRQRSNKPLLFDTMGIRSALLDWYGSPMVQESIDRLFAPLAELSADKRKTLVDTLCVYLDLQGSAGRAGEVLHLHRNAVRYRVQRAFELLGVDEEDADQRMFLHLACRGRQLDQLILDSTT